MKKTSFIRSDKQSENKRCPFGLPITEGCHYAGASVSNMCPLEFIPEEKRDRVVKANNRVYVYYKNDCRCIYSAGIINKSQSVNCNFGDTAQGMHMPAMSGSPIYPQTFSGGGMDGLYGYPLGFYADNNESRNLFTGLFSLIGSKGFEIIKEAVLDNEDMGDIVLKLENNESLTVSDNRRIANSLEQCKLKHEGK